MKYILIPIAVIIYTFIVYKGTVYYHYDIKDHIMYGQVIPYEFMNDGDLARVHLHYNDNNMIDSVTLEHVMPYIYLNHPNIGSMVVDISAMQVMLRDRGQWMQFETYEEMNDYLGSRFPRDKFEN
jgi:hypothetical protein